MAALLENVFCKKQEGKSLGNAVLDVFIGLDYFTLKTFVTIVSLDSSWA